jgi:tyrosyl-tRNA synthetase
MSNDIPTIEINREELEKMSWPEILVKCRAAKSKNQARQLIKGGGVYVQHKGKFIKLITYK